ncbi:MAG: hypothetical protein IPH05_09915 [Flavobacteriales bacterium]|nr:hypothetical protein [Flavobacteriales bacterium]
MDQKVAFVLKTSILTASKILSSATSVTTVLATCISSMSKRIIHGSSRIPAGFDSQPVSGQLLVYSYRRAGCADANWSSTLSDRDNLVHELGEIEGIGCEEGQAQGIVVYKIVTLDKIFEVDRLPISTIDNYDEYKWGFLAEYWAANIGRFRN